MWKLNSILNSTEQMWKSQAIICRNPRVRTRESLPTPPKGMDWEQDEETQQWRLIPISSKTNKSNSSSSNNTAAATTTANATDTATTSNGNSNYKNNNNTHEAPLLRRRPSSCSSVGSMTPTTTKVVLDGLPIAFLAAAEEASSSEEAKMIDDDDWDLLSEKISGSTSIGGGTVVITTTGSVRSFNSLSESNNSTTAGNALTIPLRRIPSSSTIDSVDGDRALGLLGVDYVEHIVLPSDTLQGICLAYKISLTRLRQVNHFSGNSLTGAPRKLIVPLSKKALRSGFVRVQDQNTTEYKIHAFLAKLPHIRKEAEALEYLEATNWNVAEAVQSAREDGDWDKDCICGDDDNSSTTKSSIQIIVKLLPGENEYTTFQAGQVQPSSTSTMPKPITYDGLPAIATKNVRPQDIYNAAPQHQEYGFELKSLSGSRSKEGNH